MVGRPGYGNDRVRRPVLAVHSPRSDKAAVIAVRRARHKILSQAGPDHLVGPHPFIEMLGAELAQRQRRLVPATTVGGGLFGNPGRAIVADARREGSIWVPHGCSAGTAISPKDSRSIRVAVMKYQIRCHLVRSPRSVCKMWRHTVR